MDTKIQNPRINASGIVTAIESLINDCKAGGYTAIAIVMSRDYCEALFSLYFGSATPAITRANPRFDDVLVWDINDPELINLKPSTVFFKTVGTELVEVWGGYVTALHIPLHLLA